MMRRHRWWSVPLAVALAGSLSHCAAPPERAARAPAPLQAPVVTPAPASVTPAPAVTPAPVPAPKPEPPRVESSAAAAKPGPEQKPPAPSAAAVTLLLPLDSPDFRTAADAFRQGFLAAQTSTAGRTPLDVRATDASPEGILREYSAALAAGTRVVVGPLTRSGVSVVAGAPAGSAIVLALNQPETPIALPPRFFTFGLAVDAESRVVARAAWEQGFRNAVVLSSGTPLARRSGEAFAAEWQALGGRVVATHEAPAGADYSALRAALGRAQFDVAFLAAEAGAGRLLRPYLGTTPAIFATSQINDGRADPVANLDMNGVRFADMPWMVQPTSAAVMGYPRPQGLAPDLERFYALGIDAQRITTQLAEGRTNFAFDGVTGRVAVGAGGPIERRPVVVIYRQGAPAAE